MLDVFLELWLMGCPVINSSDRYLKSYAISQGKIMCYFGTQLCAKWMSPVLAHNTCAICVRVLILHMCWPLRCAELAQYS